jgi:hypothetical protein
MFQQSGLFTPCHELLLICRGCFILYNSLGDFDTRPVSEVTSNAINVNFISFHYSLSLSLANHFVYLPIWSLADTTRHRDYSAVIIFLACNKMTTSALRVVSSEPPLQATGAKEQKRTTKLLTTQPFQAGQVIGSFKQTATITSQPSYSSLQLAAGRHVELNCPFVYLNHSCSPNCRIDTNGMAVIALKDIPTDTELTFFYPSTEWEMAEPFQCWCGSKECIGLVRGTIAA